VTSVPTLLSVILERPSLAWMGVSAWLVGLANTNAEDAFQRLLDEEVPDEELREAVYTLTTYVRRFVASVIALLPARELLEAPALRPRLGVLVRAVERALAAMSEELRQRGAVATGSRSAERRAVLERATELWARQPGRRPGAGQEWLYRQVERIARQVLALESALARLEEACERGVSARWAFGPGPLHAPSRSGADSLARSGAPAGAGGTGSAHPGGRGVSR
jgi:hypothetical protein